MIILIGHNGNSSDFIFEKTIGHLLKPLFLTLASFLLIKSHEVETVESVNSDATFWLEVF